MSNKGLAVLAVVALVVVTLAGAVWYWNHSGTMQSDMNMSTDSESQVPHQGMDTKASDGTVDKTADKTAVNTHEYAKNLIKPKPGQPVKKFSLAAKEASLKIKSDRTIPVWTYNGTVPGQEIRVTQGDFVQVELTNELKDPVTIHWHGYPLLSAMDGVPGINQDAVRPGETFTYEFSADVAGTYWYHSHQEGSKQVDKGLYGAFIVEPHKKEKIDKDFTLILDEWMSDPSGMDEMESMGKSDTPHDSMGDMDTGGSDNSNISEEEMMASMYNIYTVNGKSGSLVEPLEVSKDDVVRLRFINAGYRSHGIHIPGTDIKVVSTDGQDINGAGLIRDQVIMVAPGERYDVEFTASEDNFVIDVHDDNIYNDQLKIPVNIKGGSGKTLAENASAKLLVFDLASYGVQGTGKFTLEKKYDVDYNVELGTRMDGKTQKYTINGKVFGELPRLKLKTGDLVKFTFKNKSTMDHPMHLHGHFFEILSKNGKPVSGAAVMKDTLLVRPGEEYAVAFKGDNPGTWVQHCHELHHAAGGMMQDIEYTDFKPNYIPDPNNQFNNPE